MGIFQKLLRRRDESSPRINEMLERIMALHPHLRLARHCKARLAPAIAAAFKYLDDLVASLPPAREASAQAWSLDPCMRAFFTSPDDVARVISCSADLRAHFERNPDAQEAYAVLGMEMTERHILGVGLEGETLRRDVQKTTFSFSDHQVRMCGNTEAELRMEIIRRLLDQLALEALARIAADKSRRDVLQRERALLKTRLQLLERQGTGLRGVLGSDAAPGAGEPETLRAEIEGNERNLASLGLQSEGLDRELDTLRNVLAEPFRHIYISSRRVRLDMGNTVLTEKDAQAGAEIDFQFARIPTTPPRTRAFALVRFARANLLPARNMLDEAARVLASGVLS